jgi:hypothetical protein
MEIMSQKEEGLWFEVSFNDKCRLPDFVKLTQAVAFFLLIDAGGD